MSTKKPSVKLKAITIENYKGIDSFKMDFPVPTLPDDPNILVMGSENGLGKTSILECCALLLMCLYSEEEQLFLKDKYSSINVPDLLIRTGEKSSKITGDIVMDNKAQKIAIEIDRDGEIKIKKGNLTSKSSDDSSTDYEGDVNELIKAICGFSPSPVIETSFLLFHSYRKVQEGNPELGMMVDDSRDIHYTPRSQYRRRMEMPLSEFKLLILRSLMNKAGLFEFAFEDESEETIDKLNELMKSYAGGTISSKLRPSADNTVDFRITPVGNTPVGDNKSVTFDGLSSGQKEIISTLFLIWHHTKNNPSVVLIDEPELHLNAQWHRDFVNQLIELAPKNQYVIATHSEDIIDSVPEKHRILLMK